MDRNELEHWMRFYYKNPHPEFTRLAVENLGKKESFLDDYSAEPFIFFLSFIFQAHPDKVEEWISPYISNLPKREKEMLITSLWLSDTQNAKDYLLDLAATTQEVRKYINSLTSRYLPNLESILIDRPGVLDVLWAAFMATGEEKYLIRIISTLTYIDTQNDELKQLIGNSALWSLKSNIKAHPKIKNVCRQQLARASSKVIPILQDIID